MLSLHKLLAVNLVVNRLQQDDIVNSSQAGAIYTALQPPQSLALGIDYETYFHPYAFFTFYNRM